MRLKDVLENYIKEKEVLSKEDIYYKLDKIIDIFKNIDLFLFFRYYNFKNIDPITKKQYIKQIEQESKYQSYFCFKDIRNDKYEEKFFYTYVLIDNLSSVCNLNKEETPLLTNFFCLFFENRNKINISGFNEKGLIPNTIKYHNSKCFSPENQKFFILSFLFCMLNNGKRDKNTESFTLDYFKKEIEKIEKALKKLIDNEKKIKKLEKVIKEAKEKTYRGKINIEDKETLKNLLEPFFGKKNHKKLKTFFFFFISIYFLIKLLIVNNKN